MPTNTKCVVRQAKASDATEIAKVHVLSWQKSYEGLVDEDYLQQMRVGDRESNWLRRITEATDIVLVAEVDGQIVGFAHGGEQREEGCPYDAELRAIYILKDFQGQGIGRKLFEELLKRSKEAGYQSMNVWVLAKNTNAGKFYEAMGAERGGMKESLAIGKKDYPLAEYFWDEL